MWKNSVLKNKDFPTSPQPSKSSNLLTKRKKKTNKFFSKDSCEPSHFLFITKDLLMQNVDHALHRDDELKLGPAFQSSLKEEFSLVACQ